MQSSVRPFSVFRFMLLTFVGWFIGLVAAILGGDLMGDSPFVFTYFGTVVALFVGLAQWLIIRRFAVGPSWIWLTALGVGAGFLVVEGVLWILEFIADLHFRQDEAFYFVPIETALGGFFSGWLQSHYQLLRVSRSRGWVSTQLIGWFSVTALITGWAYATTVLWPSRHPVVLFGNFISIFGSGLLLGWLSGRKLKSMFSEHHWIN